MEIFAIITVIFQIPPISYYPSFLSFKSQIKDLGKTSLHNVMLIALDKNIVRCLEDT